MPPADLEPGTDTSDAARAPDLGRTGEWNYFSASEQRLQSEFRGRRDRLLAPLIDGCRRLGFSADHVSAVAMLLLVPFGWLSMQGDSRSALLVSAACLWGHVLLDGLDGPIARRSGQAGPRGAFTDMCLDHCGFLIFACVMVASGRLAGLPGTLYVSTYTMMVAAGGAIEPPPPSAPTGGQNEIRRLSPVHMGGGGRDERLVGSGVPVQHHARAVRGAGLLCGAESIERRREQLGRAGGLASRFVPLTRRPALADTCQVVIRQPRHLRRVSGFSRCRRSRC
ncbi:MAG: CDP-alcohol phosphatidyltransferase family protein [Planctomycetaceae bacterium]